MVARPAGIKEARMNKARTKILLWTTALFLSGLALTTPAFAGHRGCYRGQRVIVRDRFLVRPARPRFFFSLGFGAPGFFYGAAYRPAPYAVGPIDDPRPVWVPGHYLWDGGARIYVAGHWGGWRHHDLYDGY